MKSALLRGMIRMGFFWKKTPTKTYKEEMNQVLKNSPNLGYIVENIKKQNESKPKILAPQLPRYKNKLTVVMQIDQVLSYTFTPDEEGYLTAPLRNHDFYTEFDEYDACLSIYKRKNLENFINYITQECEPVIWSTGVPSYVELVLSFIDPKKKIPYVLTQKHCDPIENKQQQIDIFVKDLALLGRDLSKVIYLDSKPMSYWMYPDNCYPMEEFRADMTMQTEDLNLMILQLESLKDSKDIRKTFRERYNLREFLKEAKLI